MVKTLSLVERTGTNSVFYLNSFAMDSKQVGKAILVILSYTTLGIESRTFFYPWSFSYHSSVCWYDSFFSEHFKPKFTIIPQGGAR